jgi:hypothetical protein
MEMLQTSPPRNCNRTLETSIVPESGGVVADSRMLETDASMRVEVSDGTEEVC